MGGLKQKKVTWADLQRKSSYELREAASRSTEVEEVYRKHREDLEKKGLTLCEYIDKKLFSEEAFYVFVPNDYPYFLEEDMEHWILWINPSFAKPSKNKISKILEEELGEKDFLTFENAEENKSIPEIEHIHVFIKK